MCSMVAASSTPRDKFLVVGARGLGDQGGGGRVDVVRYVVRQKIDAANGQRGSLRGQYNHRAADLRSARADNGLIEHTLRSHRRRNNP